MVMRKKKNTVKADPEKAPKEVHFANLYRYFFCPLWSLWPCSGGDRPCW